MHTRIHDMIARVHAHARTHARPPAYRFPRHTLTHAFQHQRERERARARICLGPTCTAWASGPRCACLAPSLAPSLLMRSVSDAPGQQPPPRAFSACASSYSRTSPVSANSNARIPHISLRPGRYRRLCTRRCLSFSSCPEQSASSLSRVKGPCSRPAPVISRPQHSSPSGTASLGNGLIEAACVHLLASLPLNPPRESIILQDTWYADSF